MKRILLLGLSPLPIENESHTLGPGKRTWQFTKSLLKQDHRICLLSCRHVAAYTSHQLSPIHAEDHGKLIYYSLSQQQFEDIDWLQSIHDQFEPDCIVGATVYPSYIASQIRSDKPLWADLFGHLMAEAQTKSQVFKDDYYLSQMWKHERTVLDSADIFSVVSEPQYFATIGELGTRGRLNRSTTGYEFVRIIPCAINDQMTINDGYEGKLLRGRYTRDDDFIILWSGGYNTWTDIDTLFQALEIVFSECPSCKFVSTGGQIEGHDDLTYQRFLNMIDQSKYKENYVMRGWIPFNEIPYYWRESDIGINIDSFSYEAVLGSRNRILDWMQMDLPVLTTELCDLSKLIKTHRLGFTFHPEKPLELAELLISLTGKRNVLAETAVRARQYAHDHLTIEKTTQPLCHWINNIQSAPDGSKNRPLVTKEMERFGNLYRHYLATISNQFRYKGLAGTLKWFLSRYRNRFHG